jgi:hypothetical protein
MIKITLTEAAHSRHNTAEHYLYLVRAGEPVAILGEAYVV